MMHATMHATVVAGLYSGYRLGNTESEYFHLQFVNLLLGERVRLMLEI
jgi:hypothetical protein